MGTTPPSSSPSHNDDHIQWHLPSVWYPLETFFLPHPQYHSVAGACISEIFYGPGPLKKCERHYVALMTAAHTDCRFLIDLHTREFEREGGELHWLHGLKHITEKKFQTLDQMIHLMTHQPWRVCADTLKTVFRDHDDVFWSLNHLVHAAGIVCLTNSLCAMVHGLGCIEPTSLTETELKKQALRVEWSARDREKKAKGANKEIDQIVSRMTSLREAAKASAATDDEIEDGSDENIPFLSLTEGDENAAGNTHPHIFTLQAPLSYVDFATRHDTSFKTYKIHEFDWNHAYGIIEDVDPKMAKMFDEKFELMQTLTYNTMGDYSNVDTSEYRLAIWNYIHALFGIRHDDYNYSQVNDMLSRPMKTFIKTVVCFPERLTDELRAHVMPDFDSSEKIHALLIVIEARCQANLLYFTRALTNYYVQTDRRRRT